MNAGSDARITRDVAKQICGRNGIKAMLLGSISSTGAHYYLLLEAENSQTGDMIASEQIDVEGKEQVLKALGSAAASLREKLGEKLDTIKRFDAPIENVTTSSLEALRQYDLGVKEHLKLDYKSAILFYKLVIERDPNFAIVHARLAEFHHNNNEFDTSRSKLRNAFKHVDGV